MKRPAPAAVVVLGHARDALPAAPGPTPSPRTRVLVADPSAAARAGIRRFLAGSLDLLISGEAATGEEALRLARSEPHDVLLLHERLSAPDAFEVLSRLRGESRPPRIVVMGAPDAADLPLRATGLGAVGFLDVGATPDEFVAAVRAAARRTPHGRPPFAGSPPPPGALAPREFQVLRLLAQGRRTAEIAGALALAPSTVRTYKARLREKLGLTSEAALVRFALERRLA